MKTGQGLFLVAIGMVVGTVLGIVFSALAADARQIRNGYLADASNSVDKPAQDRTITGDKGEKIVISDKTDRYMDAKFEVNEQVSYAERYFDKADLVETSEFEYRPNELVANLLRIPGVTDVKIDTYTISVEIGEAFDARKVTDRLVTVLKDWLKKPTILENDVPKPKERQNTYRGTSGYPFYGS